MPRKSDRQQGPPSPLLSKQRELEREAAQIKARLNETREFLDKAPDLKAEAQRRRQQEAFERYNRPSRIEGPLDYRLEFVPNKTHSQPRPLRKDRSKAPLITFLLLVAFGVVVYYAWRVLCQN
jgi:hypothetical protein